MKIKFVPQNVECEIKPNESVLKVAQDHGLHIKSVCKGVPSCAECVVKIVSGDYNVFKPTPTEINLIGSAYFVDQRRLSCQLKCFGDVTIDLTEQIEKANRVVGKKPKGRAVATGDDYDPGASKAIRGSILFDGGDAMTGSSEEFDAVVDEAQRKEDEARKQAKQNRNHDRSGRPQGKPHRR